jgi:hypothetical protein
MIGAFDFEDDGRTYACCVEQPRATRTEAWWWFGVSGDRHRYAPFPAVAEDTQDSVRWRILTFYADILARRPLPSTRYHRSHRKK